ncbi:hypothetical protein L195_g054170 [Trifolium pratense]|uniref:Uncharacterized protein n=1 Tax=Trifolium pratense TaxID=57577 RepID=A0A2K3KEM3_TRIPR|nr:hypothetical protein L195_g054170 [Trifolium pratense]
MTKNNSNGIARNKDTQWKQSMSRSGWKDTQDKSEEMNGDWPLLLAKIWGSCEV